MELYDDEELLLAKSELMRRAVGGPRDDDNKTDWNSSHRRLKRRDGPALNNTLSTIVTPYVSYTLYVLGKNSQILQCEQMLEIVEAGTVLQHAWWHNGLQILMFK